MKKLPKIYQNNIDKKINNNKEVDYVKKVDIKNILNEIFNGRGYSYNKEVIIETSNKVYDTYIITRTKNNIVTLEDEIIDSLDYDEYKYKNDNDEAIKVMESK